MSGMAFRRPGRSITKREVRLIYLHQVFGLEDLNEPKKTVYLS